VSKSLWAAGHEVYVPCLTALGERAHLANPDVNLSMHIQDVVREITCSDLGEVILVGHSYGGIVITGVAEQIPDRIRMLVYLDGLIPEDGQSYADLIGPVAAENVILAVQAYGDGWKLYHRDPDPRWTPQPLQTGLEKLNVKNPKASCLPRVFISCTNRNVEDLGLVPVIQAAEKAKKDSRWQYFEIPADHNPLAEHPEMVVNTLLVLV
jgi:pimeloyl-ACP methyl ester carboxylesterase